VPLDQCNEFETLLNLRNWAKLGDRYVSEQIYVHSKTMIVDDMYALIGSANINDRSLLGERDSELAVLVMDGETLRADVNGKGSQREVRRFAHELRMDLWKKTFDFADGQRPANELAQAIEQPGCPDSWKLIQRRAAQNADAFEAAFNWVPRNVITTSRTQQTVSAKILPTWDPDLDAPAKSSWSASGGNLSAPMPFQTEFWNASRHTPDGIAKLQRIKGFIPALPFNWTQGENIRFEFPTSLVAENEFSPARDGGQPTLREPKSGEAEKVV
jgi:phospholipase D1/2